MGRPPAALRTAKRKATPKSKARNGKPRVRNQTRIDARSFQIGKAALEMFENHGYHETTISDIANRAGVSVGTIYQYAPDKEGVLKMVLMDIMDAYAREIPTAVAGISEPLLALRSAIRAYCKVVAVRHRAGLLGYQESRSLKPVHRKQMMQRELETNALIADCIERCIASGHFRSLNIQLMTYRIIMIAHAWALKAWNLHKITNLEAYIEDNIAFVFSGALTASGRRQYRKLGFELPA